jgi:hypothetical protein
MLETIQSFFHTFLVFNANAFYTILYFLKHNYFFIVVLFAIGYMVHQELKIDNFNYVNDERRMI